MPRPKDPNAPGHAVFIWICGAHTRGFWPGRAWARHPWAPGVVIITPAAVDVCMMFEGAYKLHWAIGIFQWNSIIHDLVLEENVLIFIYLSRNIQWSRQCVCAANLEVCFLLWRAGNAPLLTTIMYLYALLLIHVFPFCTGLAQQLNTVQLSLVYRPYRMRCCYRLFLSVIVETELRVLFIIILFRNAHKKRLTHKIQQNT